MTVAGPLRQGRVRRSRCCSRSRPRVRAARRRSCAAARRSPPNTARCATGTPRRCCRWSIASRARLVSNRGNWTSSPPRPDPAALPGFAPGWRRRRGSRWHAGARLVGVTSFAAVAAALRARGPGWQPASGRPGGDDGARALLVALDSRRADLYVQLFAGDCATPLAEPAAVLPDRLASYVAGLIGGASAAGRRRSGRACRRSERSAGIARSA